MLRFDFAQLDILQSCIEDGSAWRMYSCICKDVWIVLASTALLVRKVVTDVSGLEVGFAWQFHSCDMVVILSHTR